MKLQISDNIKSLIPYPPGKPLKELEREYGVTGSIKMASNENSLGPSPKAMAAIQDGLSGLHRYPDGSCHYLATAVAAKLDVEMNQLVFGNGSNEVIDFLVRAFISPGDEVITSHPSFLVYQTMVQAQDGVNIVVPLKGMGHDLETIAAKVTAQTRLIFLDNPNNPTGTAFGKEDFEDFLAKIPETVVVVLDEAYVDFVEPALRLDVRDYLDNSTAVVGLRTFSKAYGIAGLRVGFGIMNQEIADFLHRVRQPFNVNELAQGGALACVQDDEHYNNTMAMSHDGIAWLNREITALGCHVFPTQTNFFLVDVGCDCKVIYENLLQQGVIIRPMSAYGYPSYIRITVGIKDENERLVAALAKALEAASVQPSAAS